MSYHIGVDIGGTFTDLVATNGEGRFITAKTSTTPDDQALGILDGLEQIAGQYGLEPSELLRQTDVIVLGTTVATNAMLEYTGSLTGLICTKGFRDMIELRRSYREDLFDLRYPPPVPICRRQRRLGVTERINYAGEVVVPLDEGEVRAAALELRALGVEAIAVCFLFAHVNPTHEWRVREILAEVYPDAYVTLSSDVLPEIREFERVSTTLVNAYTTPRLRRHLHALADALEKSGFDSGRLLVMQSNGGVLPEDVAADRGAAAVRSGPAGGVVAAAHIGRLCGADNVIGVDMGGTSYDVSLIRGGAPQVRKDAWVSRYRVALPMLDIHAIGAGGGSIGWLDAAAALHVGPRSAGADPGPACYGKGGREPTVTDADLVLGYLNPDFFLGGRIRLDRDLADRAIERLARAMGCGPVEAAVGMLRVVNNNMSNGVRYVTVARGHDPRDFSLVAFGGAGAVHAGMQADDLQIASVLVPKDASVFCALGALISDLKMSLLHPFFRRGKELRAEDLNAAFAALHVRAEATLRHSGEAIELRPQRFFDVRYVGQAHEVTVPVECGGATVDERDLDRAITRFHDLHEALYAFKNPEQEVEILNLGYDLVGVRSRPNGTERGGWDACGASRAQKGERTTYFEVEGSFRALETSIYAGAELRPGDLIRGPAVIEEPFTTIVVCPGHQALLNEHSVYVIERLRPK